MPSLHLRGCSYAHTTASPVLSDVELDVDHDPAAHGAAGAADWVGVVGANGAGKSTLLRLLAGELAPTTGSVHVVSDVPPLLVAQQVDGLPEPVVDLALTWHGDAPAVRSRLGLDPDDVVPGAPGRGWAALSPGTRTRWRVAVALAERPDVLLLDEPSNHLDGDARGVLLDALRAHRGLGLVVSHDRRLLEQLTTRTLRVHAGAVTLHPGAYGAASARWRAAAAAATREAARSTRALRREQRQLGDLRRDRHGAQAGARRRRREAGAADPDAREAGRRFAAAKAEAALARRVGAQRSRVERAAAGEAAATAAAAADRVARGAVGFHEADGDGSATVLRLRGEVRHAGGDVLFEDVDVLLRRGDRLHLAGANGSGKTTLLRALVAAAPARTTVGTLPQDLPHGTPTWLHDLGHQQRGRVLGTAALLGVDPDRVLAAGTASPGEARKLALARLLVEPLDLVVLDEPTNHLDLPAVEALQDALAELPGTLLLVTHDDALAGTVTDRRLVVAGGRVVPG